jgi:hypothetical protein
VAWENRFPRRPLLQAVTADTLRNFTFSVGSFLERQEPVAVSLHPVFHLLYNF